MNSAALVLLLAVAVSSAPTYRYNHGSYRGDSHGYGPRRSGYGSYGHGGYQPQGYPSHGGSHYRGDNYRNSYDRRTHGGYGQNTYAGNNQYAHGGTKSYADGAGYNSNQAGGKSKAKLPL